MNLTYYHAGRLREFRPQGLQEQPTLSLAPSAQHGARLKESAAAVHAAFSRAPSLAPDDRELIGRLRGAERRRETLIWPTCSLIVEGLKPTSLAHIRRRFGLRVAIEGRHHKVLLRLPGGEPRDLPHVFAAARACYERHGAHYAQPNFIKAIPRRLPRGSGAANQWNLHNDGTVGVRGADVDAMPAWNISRGDPTIRVAVLDEGVDVGHPALRAAIVAEHDASQGHPSAQPTNQDTHGTSCAGVIVSRDARIRGLAPDVSLVAVRIARTDDTSGLWVFDEFKTSEAIDWAWQVGRAHVLSNSWNDEAGSDSITAAFDRAHTKGRHGRGAVIVCSTGNIGGPVSYPATLPYALAVGASNQWDHLKTLISEDQESGWGSNVGPELDLLAPGVKIQTTVNRQLPGLDASGPYTTSFHGTSAATPHVAAAAALLLSISPDLSETAVRRLLKRSAHRISAPGAGLRGAARLDVFAALTAARALHAKNEPSRQRRSRPNS
jgi:subtilisin family serine protease